MKKSLLTLITATCITTAIITSCSTPAQKVEKAKDDLIEADKNLDKANEEYIADYDDYRKLTAEKIEENNQNIAKFKIRIENEKKEAKADYNKKIEDLEKKNNDIKKKMDDYKTSGKANWELFKIEFNHEMEELGNSIRSLTDKK